MARNPHISVNVSPKLRQRLTAYAARHGVPYASAIRAVLETVPWDDDSVIPAVLKIPKETAADPKALHQWLLEAMAEIEAAFSQTE